MTVRCRATLHRCRCGLPEHEPGTLHECIDLDPQCGGQWLDHPDDPTKVLVVRYPGLRPGGPNEGIWGDPAEPVEEPR